MTTLVPAAARRPTTAWLASSAILTGGQLESKVFLKKKKIPFLNLSCPAFSSVPGCLGWKANPWAPFVCSPGSPHRRSGLARFLPPQCARERNASWLGCSQVSRPGYIASPEQENKCTPGYTALPQNVEGCAFSSEYNYPAIFYNCLTSTELEERHRAQSRRRQNGMQTVTPV